VLARKGIVRYCKTRWKTEKEERQAMRTEQEQKNLQAVLDFYDVVINRRQYERAGEFLDDNYIQHKPEVETGPQGVLDFVRSIYAKSPNHKAHIVRSFVDGDYVILHVHIMNAVEAKDLAVMDIFRVENGKLMEHWDVASPVPAASKNVNGVF
jgi:predicted SnoaL-like aldol condensation-catalyzing enzyme